MMSGSLDLLRDGPLARTLIVLVSILTGFLLGRMASRATVRALSKTLDNHQVMIARRLVFYCVFILVLLTGLNEAGINLSVLIGAAGVASVAIGFASQTTMSNLISGVFILLEKPFMVGDVIKINGTVGEVTTVGLLSTILKTPENTMVRLPNETLMKSEITNMTRFPVRKVEILLGLPYGVDIARAKGIMTDAVAALGCAKPHPAPGVVFKSFGDFGINVVVDFWVDKDGMGEATLLAADAIKKSLEAAGINLRETPFLTPPTRSLSLHDRS